MMLTLTHQHWGGCGCIRVSFILQMIAGLLYMSDHLRQVHHLYGDEWKKWLGRARFSISHKHCSGSLPGCPTHTVEEMRCVRKLKKSLGKSILFERGVPELSEDLCEINARYDNIIILDDLMAEATDSPVVSRLFTQGRHRNASVILLLQNMFPKGKYNTDISRNAQYLALFRSPSDRKQIGIIAERMFE